MGKTYLSVFITEYLETNARQTGDTTTIYFFCDSRVAARNTGVNILRGLVHQLILHRPKLIDVLTSSSIFQDECLFGANALETLWNVFRGMISALQGIYKTVYCILDGVDECEKKSLSSLVAKMTAMIEDTIGQEIGPTVKLAVVSRRHPSHVLPGTVFSSSISLLNFSASKGAKDGLNHYIVSQVSDLANRKGIMNTPLHRRIESRLQVRASDASFLWVRLMMNKLESEDHSQIMAVHEGFPQDLDAVYDRVVARIDDGKLEIVTRLLQWVTYVDTPLTVPALCEAIKIENGGLPSREEALLDLVQSCGHLLTVTEIDVAVTR